ncbi:NAD(P)-dependent alcohol dehydrogenase [Nonomuraea sediminis]|uniref:NAD(P)-dependent alcohol dehydrogenase n=1 Tax=Nonomuraea sediminis TaxID=2835864 RepID=UPI001BDBE15D|nr:NAD(P)-dependent alcohol dehydrogenase [Nonomuraea sediminis]
MQIEAAVLRSAAEPYAIEKLELAGPGPGQVLVRIAGVGFCHTDLLGRAGLVPTPVILGHEGSGVVEAVGPGVTGIEQGQHVVLSFDSCGDCVNCREANPAYCDTFFPRNLSATEGPVGGVLSGWFQQSSFASHAIAGVRNVVPIDQDVPLEIMGPLGCGIQTGAASVLLALKVAAGSSIAVFGAGAVGLAAVMAARVAGATTIIAVDLHESRLELARELGATHTCTDAAEVSGVQYAFDTTGVPSVIAAAVNALRPTGVCGLVGIGQGDLVLNGNALSGGKTVMGILEGGAVPQTFIPRMIELWKQGRFPFDRLVTTFPLAEIDRAEAASLSGEVVKPVLLP